MSAALPPLYLDFNTQNPKQIAVVVIIEGVSDILSNRPVYKKIRYGDPDIAYGDPGLVYGGLIRIPGVKDYLSLEQSSLTINQTIEPERGKGSVTQMVLGFVDIGQYMTRLITPGLVVEEILGREVSVKLGYVDVPYPEAYFQVFRGFISEVNAQSGTVILKLSDPNIKRRQDMIFSAKTTIPGGIDAVQTSIPVASAADFHQQVLGPDATYDDAITTYIKIEDEFMEYGPTGITGNTFTVTRASRGTTAVAHDPGTEVQAWIQIEDHAVDMALKHQLSGWNDYWTTDIPIISIRNSLSVTLGDIPGGLVLPTGVDAVRDYGLVSGDYVSVNGSGIPANNVTLKRIVRFQDVDDDENKIIVIDDPLVNESPSTATLSFRSKYDTYPTTCGMKLTPKDVDVVRHEFLKQTFLGDSANSYRFLHGESVQGKDFLESQIYLGIGCYSITQRGRLSMGITRPPIADEVLIFLSHDNILSPETITPMRTASGRFFYNQIDFTYDYADNGNAQAIKRTVDFDSIAKIGLSATLPIDNKGIKPDLTPVSFIEKRSKLFLSRFRYGATTFKVKANYEASNQIEIGDIVAVDDPGTLQISNFATGERGLGTQLFEVQQRNFQIATGQSELLLVAGTGAQATDRYATISPSSVIGVGSTTTNIIITDSYGAIFPGDEQRKWEDYLGLPILVHDIDWTYQEETTLVSFDPANPYKMNITGLSGAPPAGYIVDIPYFPNTTDPTDNALYKLVHAFWDPQVNITSGVDNFSFNVLIGDTSKFGVGKFILVHDDDFTVISPETRVASVVGTLITVEDDLGFTPASGYKTELGIFPDQSSAYRWV